MNIWKTVFCSSANLENLLNNFTKDGWNITEVLPIISMDGDCMIVMTKGISL